MRQRKGQHMRENMLHQRHAQQERILHIFALIRQQRAQVDGVPQYIRHIVERVNGVLYQCEVEWAHNWRNGRIAG